MSKKILIALPIADHYKKRIEEAGGLYTSGTCPALHSRL